MSSGAALVGDYNAAMTRHRSVASCLVAAFLVFLASAAAAAHLVTYEGTVIALKVAKYAQPGGATREVRELEVAVVDAKTRKVANRVFTIADDTEIFRSGKPVTVAQLRVEKGEKVAVVVDHDVPGDEALTVRLGVK